MKGKTVVVTGANQGIGKATALALAREGARVLIVARNPDKGRTAVEEVRGLSGSKQVELVVADLSSQAEVRRAAADIRSRVDRLDVLVNNAGVFVPNRRVTVDRLEETFAVNHIGYWLLTHELLDVLRASAPSRVVVVSSEAHRGASMHWDDLGQEKTRYRAFRAYGQSKLANLLFTYELARRLEGTGVTANALHPGVIGSNFAQTYGGAMSILVKIAKPFLLTPEEGARTSVYLASSPEVEGLTGKYFARCKPIKSNAASYDEAAQRKLWALSEQLVPGRAIAA
jgi:NAD(P)-dependent dehydrogenase (short-subunit alcohol dehydrogenase family)